MEKDFDLYMHIFSNEGENSQYLGTESSTNPVGEADKAMCHPNTEGSPCQTGAIHVYILEVRGKDSEADYGPFPYRLHTNWLQ